jgi:hypothetical protein
MRISERQLRQIVTDEIKTVRPRIKEAAAPVGAAPAAGAAQSFTDDAGYTFSVEPAGKITLTASKKPTKAKLPFVFPPDKAKGIAQKLKSLGHKSPGLDAAAGGAAPAAAGAAAGGGQLPGCNLASLKAPLTQQLASVAKIAVGTSFYADLIVSQAMPIQPADLIAAGNTLAGMGDQTQGSWVKRLAANALDQLAGPMNEYVGALLVFLGTFAQGVVNAKTAFISGGPGVKCSFKALAMAVGKAYTDALAGGFAAIQNGYAAIAQGIRMLGTVIVGILGTVGGAVAAQAAIIGQALMALANLQISTLKTLGGLLQQAIIAAGTALVGGAGGVAPAPVSESVKTRNLDRLALEMCTLAYARNLLRENVSVENRALVLM